MTTSLDEEKAKRVKSLQTLLDKMQAYLGTSVNVCIRGYCEDIIADNPPWDRIEHYIKHSVKVHKVYDQQRQMFRKRYARK